MLCTQWTMDYNYIAQWTTMTFHNANHNNIMATITIQNVTVHNDYNEQCIKWITLTQWLKWTMHNGQWTITMNSDNEQR